MEPSFLDYLPPRFRRRFRENLVVLGVVVALFVIPQHVGRYGISTFFTIVWLANSAFYLTRLLGADPRPSRWPFILVAAMTALFAYPLVLSWFAQSNPGAKPDSLISSGFLAFLGGVVIL